MKGTLTKEITNLHISAFKMSTVGIETYAKTGINV